MVNNLSFHVDKGEIFALLGSNGAGKTTTIKMILGLVKNDGGEIDFEENLTIGYSPETPYFPTFLTGREVLGYYYDIQKLSKSSREETITELLVFAELFYTCSHNKTNSHNSIIAPFRITPSPLRKHVHIPNFNKTHAPNRQKPLNYRAFLDRRQTVSIFP